MTFGLLPLWSDVILNGTTWNEESPAKRTYGMKSLTFVRDDMAVMLKGFALESLISSVMSF